jgi:hypothetical protein
MKETSTIKQKQRKNIKVWLWTLDVFPEKLHKLKA